VTDMEEDYRKIWREFFCTAFTINAHNYRLINDELRAEAIKGAINSADDMLKAYMEKKVSLRELNLKAFR
jgi:hypothetical protein